MPNSGRQQGKGFFLSLAYKMGTMTWALNLFRMLIIMQLCIQASSETTGWKQNIFAESFTVIFTFDSTLRTGKLHELNLWISKLFQKNYKIFVPQVCDSLFELFYCHSDWSRIGRSRSRCSSPGRVKNLHFSNQPLTQLILGTLSQGLKRPGRQSKMESKLAASQITCLHYNVAKPGANWNTTCGGFQQSD
jgi:hypothetical protein